MARIASNSVESDPKTPQQETSTDIRKVLPKAPRDPARIESNHARPENKDQALSKLHVARALLKRRDEEDHGRLPVGRPPVIGRKP